MSAAALASEELGAEVAALARSEGVAEELPAVLEMTRQTFPTSSIFVDVDRDPEIVGDRHIVVVVRPLLLSVDEALEARWRWHQGLFACCPADRVAVFRLGLELP